MHLKLALVFERPATIGTGGATCPFTFTRDAGPILGPAAVDPAWAADLVALADGQRAGAGAVVEVGEQRAGRRAGGRILVDAVRGREHPRLDAALGAGKAVRPVAGGPCEGGEVRRQRRDLVG